MTVSGCAEIETTAVSVCTPVNGKGRLLVICRYAGQAAGTHPSNNFPESVAHNVNNDAPVRIERNNRLIVYTTR